MRIDLIVFRPNRTQRSASGWIQMAENARGF
jgi:hypothetical protein